MAYARTAPVLMVRRPVRQYRRRGMAGLGECYDTESGVPIDCGSGAPIATPAPAVYTPVGSGSGSNSDFWQGLTAGALNIFGKVVSPPAYQQVTRDAYGNVISTTVAQGAAGGPATGAALGGAISPNTLLIGGGLVGLLVLVMAMKKGN